LVTKIIGEKILKILILYFFIEVCDKTILHRKFILNIIKYEYATPE